MTVKLETEGVVMDVVSAPCKLGVRWMRKKNSGVILTKWWSVYPREREWRFE